jgi:hypothetical protein
MLDEVGWIWFFQMKKADAPDDSLPLLESVLDDLSMYAPICLEGHQKNIRKYPCLESCIADRDSCSSHH